MTSVFLLGEPATGKTTVARLVLQGLRARIPDELGLFEFGKLRGGASLTAGIYCFGLYDEQLFSGTDRLSNSVVSDACDFLRQMPPSASVFLEGDRLANRRFISALFARGPARLIHLYASEPVLAARRAARGNKQSPSFLKSRATKLYNLGQLFETEMACCEKTADLSMVADSILRSLFLRNCGRADARL